MTTGDFKGGGVYYTAGNFGKLFYFIKNLWNFGEIELPIQKCRSRLQGCVDPLLTVGTTRRVPRVGNKDDRQTAAAGQHWMGVHRLSSLLSDLLFTTTGLFNKKSRAISSNWVTIHYSTGFISCPQIHFKWFIKIYSNIHVAYGLSIHKRRRMTRLWFWIHICTYSNINWWMFRKWSTSHLKIKTPMYKHDLCLPKQMWCTKESSNQ